MKLNAEIEHEHEKHMFLSGLSSSFENLCGSRQSTTSKLSRQRSQSLGDFNNNTEINSTYKESLPPVDTSNKKTRRESHRGMGKRNIKQLRRRSNSITLANLFMGRRHRITPSASPVRSSVEDLKLSPRRGSPARSRRFLQMMSHKQAVSPESEKHNVNKELKSPISKYVSTKQRHLRRINGKLGSDDASVTELVADDCHVVPGEYRISSNMKMFESTGSTTCQNGGGLTAWMGQGVQKKKKKGFINILP